MKTTLSVRTLLGLDRAARLSFPGLEKLRDRDLGDIGLGRAAIGDRPLGAPVDVPNDRV